MTRLIEKRQIHWKLLIVLFISVRGDSPFEAPSTCTPKNNAPGCGGCAEISYSFIGDFENSDILVYKGELEEKIVHSFLRDGKRECEKEPGYNFSLSTSKERTHCILVIENVTEQTAVEYVFHTLDPPKRCKPCILQAAQQKISMNRKPGPNFGNSASGEMPEDIHNNKKKNTVPQISKQPEVNRTQPAGERLHSPDKESPNQTGSNQTSTYSPGTIAGIVVGALIVLAVTFAVAVVVVKKKKRTCCKKRGWAPYIPPTIEDGVTSSENGGQTPCIRPTTEGDNGSSSDSSQGSTTPLINDNIPTV